MAVGYYVDENRQFIIESVGKLNNLASLLFHLNALMNERADKDQLLHRPQLTDGVIFLRPLEAKDAADYLAGEDEEMAKWVSGGRSTPASTEAFIRNNLESWRSGGPRRAFGVFNCASNRLAGFIEVNLARLAGPGQVNISYGVFPQWRRQGIALRAINLMDEYLRTATEARQMVLRGAPGNTASLKLAEKAGFAFCGLFDEPEGRMARYVRDIKF